MSKKVIKVGIVGLGNQGQKHLNALYDLKLKMNIEIVGLCDTYRPAIVNRKIPFYENYLDFFNKTKPDIVIIAVPNYLHEEITISALKKGIHVIKEKPLSINYSSALRIVNASIANQKFIVTTQQRFFSPLYQNAKKTIQDFGIPTSFSYIFTLNDMKNTWRWNFSASGGGAWLNMGWHAIAMIQWLIGEISSIELFWKINGRRSWDYSTDHTAYAKVLLRNGCNGTIFVSCAHPTKQELMKIKYNNQTVYLSRNDLKVFQNGKLKTLYNKTYPEEILYLNQLKKFIKDISNNTSSPIFDLEVMKTIQMGMLSAEMNNSTIRINNAVR